MVMHTTMKKHQTTRRQTDASPKMVDMPGMEISAMGLRPLSWAKGPAVELKSNSLMTSCSSARGVLAAEGRVLVLILLESVTSSMAVCSACKVQETINTLPD